MFSSIKVESIPLAYFKLIKDNVHAYVVTERAYFSMNNTMCIGIKSDVLIRTSSEYFLMSSKSYSEIFGGIN